jgi:hypothetical protein
MANDKIVATLDGNFVRMIDVVENCNNHWCSKIRLQNQSFGEFTLGYDYAVNELVLNEYF